MDVNDQGVRYRFGPWQVEPEFNRIRRGETEHQLEPRVMAVLDCLLRRPGELVTTGELLSTVWAGRVVEQNAVQQRISRLRRLLGDDARRPSFIETISRKGYRTIAGVERLGARVEAGTTAAPRLLVLPGMLPEGDADGARMHDELAAGLRTCLARSSRVSVIGRSSSAELTALDVDATIAQLGVSHLLQIRLRTSGGVRHLDVELIEARTREVLWVDQFDCSGAARVSIEARVASALLTALGITPAAARNGEEKEAGTVREKPAPSAPPRIAIMPLRRLDEAADTEAVAARLERAIPELLNGPELKPLRWRDPQTARGFDVVASPALAGTSSDPLVVLDHSGAEYALAGTVRTAAGRARVSLSLSFADARRVVWSHTCTFPTDAPPTPSSDAAMHAASSLVREVALLRYEWQVKPAMSELAFTHLTTARRRTYARQLGEYVAPEELLQHWQAFDACVLGSDNVAEFTSLREVEEAILRLYSARIVPARDVADLDALTRRQEAVATRAGIHPFWNEFCRIGQAMNAFVRLDLVGFERFLSMANPCGFLRGVPDQYHALLTGDLVGIRDAALRERDYLAYRSALAALGEVEPGLEIAPEALAVLVIGHGRARVLAQEVVLLAMAGRQEDAQTLAERTFAEFGGAHPDAFVTMFAALGDPARARTAMAEARRRGHLDRMQIDERLLAHSVLEENDALHALIDRVIETRHAVGLGTILIHADPENRLVQFVPGMGARTRDPLWLERVARVRAIVDEALEGTPAPPRALAYQGVP
jgi:DNA-binding winged helix-turn-helix (wHTH) protein